MTHPRNLLPLALAAALALLPGCGSAAKIAPPPDYGSEEGLKIAQLVSHFNEDKADPVKFRRAFADNPPADWKRYDRFTFEVKSGSPKVDGAAAAATVTVHKEANYEVVATVEWTFAKVGDVWKLKTAPTG